MFYLSFSCKKLLHGNCVLTRFNFSIKILLPKITFWFWILLYYPLNMLSFCIGSISWCVFIVSLFRSCYFVPLFRGILIVPPVFCCPFSVLLFLRCSVFRCSWFYSMLSWVDLILPRNAFYLIFSKGKTFRYQNLTS